MMKYLSVLLILVSFIIIQCKPRNNNVDLVKEPDVKEIEVKETKERKKETFFKESIKLTGTGESGLASFFLDWNIIIENDSIIMLSSYRQNKDDMRLNQCQYFGYLAKSEKYTYEIIISDYFSIWGCNKPYYEYLNDDTIQFWVDSALLSSVGNFRFITNNTVKNDTFNINKSHLYYIANNEDKANEIILTLIPNEKSGLFPATINSGIYCCVFLTNIMNTHKYFLNENQGKYELIIDITIQRGLVGRKCDNCFKIVELENNNNES